MSQNKKFHGKILNPCIDSTFKSLFTTNSPESNTALRCFLQAVLGHQVTEVRLQPNELSTETPFDKQTQFDIACVLDETEPVNVEMQGVNREKSYDKRAEYNAAHLMNHYVPKGLEWKDVPKCYQISVLNFIYDAASEEIVSHYTMRTDDNRRLSSRLNIYFIELPKLKKLNHLKLEQLTSIERWIKFLLYANDEKQTALIKKLSTMEEGIMQAKTVLDILSQDEINWYREWAEIKRVNDELTWKNAALREGREEGEAKGKAEGLAEGLEKGRSEGMKQANIENAISFYKSGVDFSIIEKCTGITKEQILQELKEES